MTTSVQTPAKATDKFETGLSIVFFLIAGLTAWCLLRLPGVTGPEMISEAKISIWGLCFTYVAMGLLVLEPIRKDPVSCVSIGAAFTISFLTFCGFGIWAFQIVHAS